MTVGRTTGNTLDIANAAKGSRVDDPAGTFKKVLRNNCVGNPLNRRAYR